MREKGECRDFEQGDGIRGRRTEDDSIGCCQINTQSTSSCRKAENEDIGTGCQLSSSLILKPKSFEGEREKEGRRELEGGKRKTSQTATQPASGTHFVCQAVTISLL